MEKKNEILKSKAKNKIKHLLKKNLISKINLKYLRKILVILKIKMIDL